MRKVAVIILMFSLLGLFAACGKEENKTVYSYKESSLTDEFSLTKMVVYADRAELYFEDEGFEKVSEVYCYDSDFGSLTNPEISFEKGVLTLKSDAASQISGIYLYVSNGYFRLRYLDSDQYAVLKYEFVDDIGYMEFGDREAYYTQEELERFEAEKQQEEAADRRVFKYLEGTWVSEDGKSKKVFYEQDGVFKVDVTTEEMEYTMSFKDPDFGWDYEEGDEADGPVTIGAISGDCKVEFTLWDNFTYIQDSEDSAKLYKE